VCRRECSRRARSFVPAPCGSPGSRPDGSPAPGGPSRARRPRAGASEGRTRRSPSASTRSGRRRSAPSASSRCTRFGRAAPGWAALRCPPKSCRAMARSGFVTHETAPASGRVDGEAPGRPFRPVVSSPSPSEPDVRVPPHPALREHIGWCRFMRAPAGCVRASAAPGGSRALRAGRSDRLSVRSTGWGCALPGSGSA
jgi:hypothetical protein